MKRLLVATLVPLLLTGAGSQPAAEDVIGLWRNPKGSVYVRTALCGDRLCGEVVCATPKAIAKARAKGTEQLVGTRLLEDYWLRNDGKWKGKVFVPDLQGRFDSIITPIAPDRLEIRGCMLAGLICKEQTWQRTQTTACDGSS